MGLMRFRWAIDPVMGCDTWQAMQSRLSVLAARVLVSVFRPLRMSMVQANTGQPAASTRLTIFSVSPQEAGHVELIPGRGAQGLGDVFHAGGGDGGEHLHGLLSLGRAGNGQFALRMKLLLAAHGADIDRHVPAGAKYIGPQIGFRHAHQAAGAQLVVRHRLAIHAERQIVIHARGQVAPMRRGKRFAGQGFKVHHIERIFWAGNGGNRFLGRGGAQQRASGEEAEEFATGGQACESWHVIILRPPGESI